MFNIYKYTLNAMDRQVFYIPAVRILSVEEQREEIVMCALVDDQLPSAEYEILVLGTDNLIPEDIVDFTFLGTVKMYSGKLMFHVFYKRRPTSSGTTTNK